MPAVEIPTSGEVLLSGRDQRVAVGEDLDVRPVKAGQEWPEGAAGRIDVLIRTGYVLRFVDGKPDPRSIPYMRRIGLAAPLSTPAQGFVARAAERRDRARLHGHDFRIYRGRPDGEERSLFEFRGRAYALYQGRPDGAVDVELAPKPKRKTTRRKAGQRRRRKE